MIAIRILRVVGKAVGLTAVGGFLFAGIFAAPLPRQAAETQSSAPARTSQPAGEAVPVSVPRLVQFNGTLKDAAARPLAPDRWGRGRRREGGQGGEGRGLGRRSLVGAAGLAATPDDRLAWRGFAGGGEVQFRARHRGHFSRRQSPVVEVQGVMGR